MTVVGHAREVVPDDLIPRWQDLPALAWLAAGRFRIRLPSQLGFIARVVMWLGLVPAVFGARAERRLAAWHRHALVIVAPYPSVRFRWRAWGARLAGAVICGLALAVSFMLIIFAGFMVGRAGAPSAGRAVIDLGFGTFALLGVVVLVSAVLALPASLVREPARRRARASAAKCHPRLVEASTLAAGTGQRAATVLVRALLSHADHHQIAVLADPRDERVAELYRRLGFRPIPAVPGRMLCRPPSAR